MVNYIYSLTTIPAKFDNLYLTIDSLLNQTIKATKIIINIPKQYSLRFNSSIEKSIDGNPVYVKGFELKNWNKSFGEFSTIEKAKNEKAKLETSENIKNLEIKPKYIISDDRKSTIPVYKSTETGFFPRMWSKEPLHIEGRVNNGYLGWSGKKSKKNIFIV